MLQKLSARSATSLVSPSPSSKATLHLAQPGETPLAHGRRRDGALADLLVIASRRCLAFFAEAAVLVLVFGVLDYFMLKGRVELPWILGALAISVCLLAASIVMDLGAHRWIKAHP